MTASHLVWKCDVNVPPDVLASDTANFYPFTSVVIVFGGNGTAPLAAPDGAFTIAQNLYAGINKLNAGYDVHAYNEEVASMNPNAALQEVTAAYNLRDVEQLAILAYSQGGGATLVFSNQLAGALVWRIRSNLPATSMPLGTMAGTQKTSGRPCSGYHVHYRQANPTVYIAPGCTPTPNRLQGLRLQGVNTPPGPSINVNVTTTAWGAVLHHCSIDNDVRVIGRMIDGYHLPPGPGEANHFGITDIIVP